MHIPVATYRIQFNSSLGFQEARKIVPYLAALGISDIYASPIFKARKASAHGYDVVDPNRLNAELGEYGDFEALVSELKNYGMRWIQDIVPNHMAYDSQNQILMDVLENGNNSRYFRFFDIEWDHFYESLKGRVLAPFLGKFYAECLENGEIQLRYAEPGLAIHYYNLSFPLRLDSYVRVFGHNIGALEQKLGRHNPDFAKFLGAIHLLEALSRGEEVNSKYDQISHAKAMLRELYAVNSDIKNFMDSNIEFFNGKKGEPESFNNLDGLLFEQLFRLSFWKVATEEINYRRFFNINGLICLRVEEEEVLNYTHGLIFRLMEEGKFSGIRIDHIDGLYDPAVYLSRIRDKAGPAYIIVEKILDFNEELPAAWPVQGTTGYDFLNYVNGIFCKKENEKEFTKIYYRFTGLHASYEELVCEKKRLIIGKHMAGNIENLAYLMKKIASRDRHGRDITLYGLKRALVEIMTQFPVYRTYINNQGPSETDSLYIREAIERARKNIPALEYELNFIEKFLLLQFCERLNEEEKKQLIQFVMRFQQLTGPLMAKGFEDTVLYVYNKFISLNEVGGNPNRFGNSPAEFHGFSQRRVAAGQLSLNATSTHDSKRGEDVRARLNVLSEIPEEWKKNLRAWSRMNKPKKRMVNNNYAPDENDEYFLYQTLIGAFPFFEQEYAEFAGRIKNYIVKAVREAKVHTAWIKPDTEYEDACVSFVDKILNFSEENRFLGEFLPLQKKVAYFGIFNSLSQTLIKMTAPGVPDFYRGAEFWDLSLVDPDNRRPVDFEKRKTSLEYIATKSKNDLLSLPEELFSTREDGRLKLFLIYRALQARKEKPGLFGKGDYVPLEAEGKFKQNVIAFARNHGNDRSVTIVPRFLTALIKEGQLPAGQEVWADTCIVLPEEAGGLYKDVVSGEMIRVEKNVSIGEVFKYFPVSLLIKSDG
ncbi:MAG: malto-oligosyltrehalose synthase [Candidatus Omnitrophota bacterium]